MNNLRIKQKSERGSAGVKMMAVLAGLFLVGYAGLNYVPTAYQGQSFKQDMQTAVVQGMAPPRGMQPVDMVKEKIQSAIAANNIPADAVVQIKPNKDSVSAHVMYSKQVSMLPFGLYKYNYQFDHTATPTGFLLKP